MDSCIFCKIIRKEIPGHVLYEDDQVLAFLDISQTTKGHTLVIPKKHIIDVFEMTEEDMAHVFKVVPKIANALRKAFNARGMNLVNNNDAVAGQTVFHYHVHLIPRYQARDTFMIQYANNMDQYPATELHALKVEIEKHL